MTVTAVRKDPDALTMTVDADFDASVERVWQLWADPRQLERWWGPPTYPATVTRHELAAGSRVEYHMTGPDGDQPKGYWEILEVEAPHRLVVRDGFRNEDGSDNTEMPDGEFTVTIRQTDDGRTRMSIENRFASTEAMEQLLAMGQEEGMTQAMGQIDAILDEGVVAGVSANEPITNTIHESGVNLTYDIRVNHESKDPVLFLIGSPMAAAGFQTLAGHFRDRTIVTYDPRGSERSALDDPSSEITPQLHAEDVHRVIKAVNAGPVDLFASSGGAVNALELVARHPDDVRTLVAHEPPLASQLPDREHAMAITQAIHDTYQARGWGAGMAYFMAIVGHRGEITPELVAQPAPDPAMFGMPTEDDGSRTDPMLSRTIVNITHYEPDYDALKAAPTRIVIAAGEGSEGEMANRGAYAVAERLGTGVTVFPDGHGGFLGGEYGQTGDPDAFAARLREVLEG